MIVRQLHSLLRASAGFALLVSVLTGCGGSGSSGFDGALQSEAEAIEVATSEGICVEFKGTTYCASGVPLDVDDQTIVVEFEPVSQPVPCAPDDVDPGCTSTVGFEPGGLPSSAILLAAWAQSDDGPWTRSEIDTSAPGSENPDDVVVNIPEDNPSGAIVVAVLVYLDGVPAGIPDQAAELREFRADAIYVSSDVAVEGVP